jgi:uncharacterized protein YwqG
MRLPCSDRLFELTKSTPLHRIVGYPDLVQFDVMVEAESFYHRVDLQELYDSPPSDISNWVLFLQIDSDNAEAKMFWGDGGRLYFIINQDALVNQQFSDVQCIMQC